MADPRTILVDDPALSPNPTDGDVISNIAPEGAPAPGAAAPQVPELPEKYRGKSPVEIAEMHMNAEKKIGMQANEIGAYRDLVPDLINSKRRSDLAPTPLPEDKTPSITDDEFLQKPVQSVQTLLKEAVGAIRTETADNASVAALDAAEQAFTRDFPQWRETVADPKFQDWANKSQSRLADAARAARSNDATAARRLMVDYHTENPLVTAPITPSPDDVAANADAIAAPTGVAGAVAVATDATGNAGLATPKKIWTKTQILKDMTDEPEKYNSVGYQTEMYAAMAEGRYRRQ